MINEEGFTNEKLSYFKSKTRLCEYKIEGSIVFAYHNPSVHLIVSLTESVKRAQTVFGHLKFKFSSNLTITGQKELQVVRSLEMPTAVSAYKK